MNSKIIDYPLFVVSALFLLGVQGVIKISLPILYSVLIFLFIYIMLLLTANVITGGYNNDWCRDSGFGDLWREVSIAMIPLIGILFVIIYKSILENVVTVKGGYTIIVASIFLGYLLVKLRYKMFSIYSPQEKGLPMRFADLKKYIRWYHWLLLFTICIMLLPLIL